jgi:helix-turn-helix protein
MSINYFFSSKKKLETILSHLNEIKLMYCEMNLENYNKDYIKHSYIQNLITDYEAKISEVKLEIDHLHQIICSNCEHSFVEDMIDITPDKSQIITYCTKCEYTKEYGFNKIK